jgi:hypothetical protein
MSLYKTVTSRLGGFKDANPEILTSYPPLDEDLKNSDELLLKCLPIGCSEGDLIENKYNKSNLISYVFKIEKVGERDDLFSFSILLNKGMKPEIYKLVLKRFIDKLNETGLLQEDLFIHYREKIYKCFNEAKNLKIKEKVIPLSEIFRDVKKEFQKNKPKLKGSFL